MRDVSIFSFRDFYIVRHTRHRRVYLLWLAFICNVFRRLIYFFDLYAQVLGFSVFQWTFLSEVFGSGEFAVKWSSDLHLKHVSGFWPLRSFRLLLELRGLKGCLLYPFYFWCCLNHFSVGCEPPHWLHLDQENFSFIISYWIFQFQIINL